MTAMVKTNFPGARHDCLKTSGLTDPLCTAPSPGATAVSKDCRPEPRPEEPSLPGKESRLRNTYASNRKHHIAISFPESSVRWGGGRVPGEFKEQQRGQHGGPGEVAGAQGLVGQGEPLDFTGRSQELLEGSELQNDLG